MPVYVVHGFRWPRDGFTGIRVHAIVHDLEDCSVEYIQNENSRSEILSSFRKAFPDIMKELEGPGRRLDFLEQYDPEDELSPQAVSQPYAFVGDRVFMFAGGPNASVKQPHEMQESLGTAVLTSSKKRERTPAMSKAAPFNAPAIPTDLSVNVGEVIADGPGLSTQAWEALADLRDKIAEGEKIGWWVVYNGDPERACEDFESEKEEEEEDEEMDLDEKIVQEKEEKRLPRLPKATHRQEGHVPPPVSPPPISPVRASQGIGQVNTSILPKVPASSHDVPGQTKLPTRDKNSAVQRNDMKPESDREKEKPVPLEPEKVSETTKSQGLRKKFFGKRTG